MGLGTGARPDWITNKLTNNWNSYGYNVVVVRFKKIRREIQNAVIKLRRSSATH